MARAFIVAGLLMSAASSWAQSVESGDKRLSVVELFTSEGCSSCPPADEWLRANFPRPGAVAIALHVDYWDEIGWVDPFSSRIYTDRQRVVAGRSGGRVYTPELALNGHEASRGDLLRAIGAAAHGPARNVRLKVTREADKLRIEASSDPETALVLHAAVVEDGLRVEVLRGENAGRTLLHEHVVRALVDGRAGVPLDATVTLLPKWDRARLGVVAFVENTRAGTIEQAVQLAGVR